MKYVISVFYDDAEVDVKTNDVEIAILEMLRADANGVTPMSPMATPARFWLS